MIHLCKFILVFCINSMFADKVLRIGSGLYPDLHACATQWVVLCTVAFPTATNPLYNSGERWCSRQEQELTYYFHQEIMLSHVYSTPTPSSAVITTNSLDIFVCVFYMYGIAFNPEYIFVFIFNFCVCRVLEVSSTGFTHGKVQCVSSFRV